MNKFATMKIGDDVDFYALVESSQKRYTPNKSAYYGITLSDGDTSINEYAGKAQYVINGLQVPNENEVNIKDFYRSAPITEEDLRTGIKNYIRKINNEVLKNLVVGLIAKVPDDYFVFPAAMSMHHNYFNGLAKCVKAFHRSILFSWFNGFRARFRCYSS